GYSMLIDALVGALDPRKVKLQLNTIVHEVRWRRGRVSVDATQEGRLLTITAKRAVIALPLGVLQRSSQLPRAVRFEPALASKHKALAGLAVGPVIKILLRFRTAFWEELDDGRYRDAAFIHSAGAAF